MKKAETGVERRIRTWLELRPALYFSVYPSLKRTTNLYQPSLSTKSYLQDFIRRPELYLMLLRARKPRPQSRLRPPRFEAVGNFFFLLVEPQ